MNRKAFYVLMREYRESKDVDLGHVLLISFKKLSEKDQLDILAEQADFSNDKHTPIEEADEEVKPRTDEETIKDVIKEANELELIKMKSFLVKFIIVSFVVSIILFIGLSIYYVNMGTDNGYTEYLDQFIELAKLIILNKTD